MIVLGLDFESTFLDPVDPKQMRIIEVGAVLWDTDRKQPLQLMNELVQFPVGLFDDRITNLTGLTLEDFDHAKSTWFTLEALIHMSKRAKAVVAHNGNGFDKPLLTAELGRYEIPDSEHILNLPWYDTMTDINFPEHIDTRKLAYLGPAHGFLNPFSHRAVFDVLTMLKVMSHYDIMEIDRRSKAVKIEVVANTRKPWEDGGKSNSTAKSMGFRWNGELKVWLKTILEEELQTVLSYSKAQGLPVAVYQRKKSL